MKFSVFPDTSAGSFHVRCDDAGVIFEFVMVKLRLQKHTTMSQEQETSSAFRIRGFLLLLIACLWFLASPVMAQDVKPVKRADEAEVKRVLLLHSLGQDFAPFNGASSGFRTELAQQSGAPIEFFQASLETARVAEGGSETPFVEYLRALFGERRPHLLVPFGAPAMNFLQRHRDRLFPRVPLLAVAVDKRRLSGVKLGANATAVGVDLDLPEIVENILRILPSTTDIEVIIGNSPIERFWLAELRRDFQPFTDRVRFTWLNEVSFQEIRRRLASLPRHSAIVYAAMLVDAAGVPHEEDRALEVLRRDSNAPIFGLFDNQIGDGIVGGPFYPLREVANESVRLALRILNGAPADSIQPVFLGPAAPVYDWRELTRWKINEDRLPPRSIIRFRQPSLWNLYHWYIIGALSIIALQAVLIFGLVLQRARRRRAEAELRESQEFMELSTNAGELGLWARDVERNDLWANSRLRALFGFGENDELRLEHMIERIHPDDRAQIVTEIGRAQQTGAPFEGEYRVLTPDGSERWVVARGRADDERGRNGKRRMGVVFDITERKRAEQEIRGLKERLEAENIYLKEEISAVKGFDNIVGESDVLKYVLMRVEQVAKANTPVLLQGETGVGKELVARAIQKKSSRSDDAYVKVNCATLPEALVESELFGHEKGSFTGADRQRKGRFELADGGTILLDEVAELPKSTQAKLLRVLQEGEFERVGGSRTVKVNVRVIAATNRKLLDEVSAGRFREDLYYRLNVYPITMPPLRERREDIPLLVSHFARQIGERLGRSITEVPAQVMCSFTDYNWPGNIRELQNVIERSVIVSADGVLRLPEPLFQTAPPATSEGEISQESATVSSLNEAEREHILRALEASGWRIEGPKGAAAILQLHPSTLRSRMKKLGLSKVLGYTSQAPKSSLH